MSLCKGERSVPIWTWVLLVCVFGATLYLDTSYAETGEVITLEEICVTATRTEKNILNIPYTTYFLSSEKMQDERMVRTVPEALDEIPGIMVQKTSHGQGSPFIRGFSGFRTLFLIDGIRLNNSTFRDGPNQYWNTVDPLSINRLEVIEGPSSVLYGSDAIGGTVSAMTIGPEYDKGHGYNWNGRVYYRYADAERSNTGRGELGGAYDRKFGWILGYSYKDFGNVEGGKNVGVQQKTGYDEWDGDLKVEYTFGSDSKLTFAYQKVDQDDAWRTHKTEYGISWEGTTIGDEKRRSLDQDRDLTYLQYRDMNMGSIFDRLSLSISYQRQEEERHRVKKDNRSDVQGVDVHTTGIGAQIGTFSDFGIWSWGIEYYHDEVDSFQRKYNADGTFDKSGIQGPVGDDASYDLVGVYVQDDIYVTEKLGLILGTRYNYVQAKADKVKDPQSGEVMSIDEDWDAIVGSLRALYHVDNEGNYNLFGGVSQGFRAPNLSDLTRLDTARSNEIETAAPDLDPEKYVTYEIGLKTRHDKLSSQIAYFYTDIKDMIVRTPTGRVVDGDNEVTKKNAGNGYVQGIEVSLSWRFLPQLTASAVTLVGLMEK